MTSQRWPPESVDDDDEGGRTVAKSRISSNTTVGPVILPLKFATPLRNGGRGRYRFGEYPDPILFGRNVGTVQTKPVMPNCTNKSTTSDEKIIFFPLNLGNTAQHDTFPNCGLRNGGEGASPIQKKYPDSLPILNLKIHIIP